MISRNKIINEVSRLNILYNILFFNEISLIDYSSDMILNESMEVKFYEDEFQLYQELFDDVLDYLDLINIKYHFETVEEGHYVNFFIDYTNMIYDLTTLTQENKDKYGLLNVFMLMKDCKSVSKYLIEKAYGKSLSYPNLKKIFKNIKLVTQQDVIKTKDLNYSLSKFNFLERTSKNEYI